MNTDNNYSSEFQYGGASVPKLVADVTETERAEFYRKTYTHVALALLAFIAVEALLLRIIPDSLLLKLGGRYIWLFVIGAFWLGSVLANKWAHSLDRNTQYLGLGVYVVLEALIFWPMIRIALLYADGGSMISQAGIITLAMFAGLTAVVFFTRVNFSFLRTVLVVGGFVSLGLIVAGALFGFDLGLWFSAGMIALASGAILYETYNIKNEYATNQYVGAALQLFASVMLLFWYILRIFLSRRD